MGFAESEIFNNDTLVMLLKITKDKKNPPIQMLSVSIA